MRTIAGNGAVQSTPPLPETLSACRTNAFTAGFRDTFSLTPRGLYSMTTSRYYRPEQVTVHRTMRIEGNPNPAENATVYIIETADGVKGLLTDPAGTGPGTPVTPQFIEEVEAICRQMGQYGRHQC